MTEYEALLAAILATPDDDLPRLVFADWLEENGDPDRAEFIRVHIARWRTKEENRYPRPMKARIAQLLAEHESIWRSELPYLPGVTWGRYWRGFISEAKFSSPEAFVKHAAAAFSATPIQMVQLSGLGLEMGEAVCRLPQLTGLYGLRLDDVSSEPNLWRMLTESVWFDQLYHLIVHPCRPMGGWTVSSPQQQEVVPMVFEAVARPQSRLKKVHLDMDGFDEVQYVHKGSNKTIITGGRDREFFD